MNKLTRTRRLIVAASGIMVAGSVMLPIATATAASAAPARTSVSVLADDDYYECEWAYAEDEDGNWAYAEECA